MRVSARLAAAFLAAGIAAGASTIVQAGSPVIALGSGELFANEDECGGRNNPCKPVCTDKNEGKDCKRMGSER